MARPPRRERRRANLHCNACGHQFVGRAWFVSIETSDLGTVEWNIDTNATRGIRCPNCGRKTVQVLDD